MLAVKCTGLNYGHVFVLDTCSTKIALQQVPTGTIVFKLATQRL